MRLAGQGVTARRALALRFTCGYLLRASGGSLFSTPQDPGRLHNGSFMSEVHHHVIAPPKGWQPLDVAELWRFRSLLSIFVWRDLKVRYKQSALGLMWVILQPLAL